MKRLFLRAIAYVGLYLEIGAATCRWLSYTPPRRVGWKYFVTKELVVARYLPPTREELDAQAAQHRINCEHVWLTWAVKQPETIQTCLRANREAYIETLKSSARIEKREWVPEDRIRPNAEFWDRYSCSYAIPKFVKDA